MIKLLIISLVAVVSIVYFYDPIFNNRMLTEARAYQALEGFITENKVSVKRSTCAGDSDGDGYGTCTINTEEGEKIYLQCPVNFIATKVFGAVSCKEVNVQVFQIGRQGSK